MVFQKELKKLGLKDKESAVYLACLELGPSPVQQISRKAKVVRATTYVVLDSLLERGLVTQYKEGKKTLFSAEPPQQLIRLVEKQEEALTEKKRDVEQLLPQLQLLMKSQGGQPSVRYFDGEEGLRSMRREMVMYARQGDVWYNFSPMDYLESTFGQIEASYSRHRASKGISAKTIFTTRSAALKKEMMKNASTELSERRYIEPEKFPSTSGMTIYRDRIAIGSFTGKLGGVIIESEAMADMMTRLFDLAWKGAGENAPL